MIAIRSMRPDFLIDIFWASSIRSKLAQRLSAVAVSGEFQILGGPTYFYMGDSHFIWSPPTTAQCHFECYVVKAAGMLEVPGIRTRAKDLFLCLLTNWASPHMTTGGRALLKLLI